MTMLEHHPDVTCADNVKKRPVGSSGALIACACPGLIAESILLLSCSGLQWCTVYKIDRLDHENFEVYSELRAVLMMRRSLVHSTVRRTAFARHYLLD